MFCENERFFVSFHESRCPFGNLVVLSHFSLSFHEVQKENRIYRNFRTLLPTKGKSRLEKLNMRFWFSFLNFVKGQLRVPSCTSLRISPLLRTIELLVKLAALVAFSPLSSTKGHETNALALFFSMWQEMKFKLCVYFSKKRLSPYSIGIKFARGPLHTTRSCAVRQ
jgi:hypothetical protein